MGEEKGGGPRHCHGECVLRRDEEVRERTRRGATDYLLYLYLYSTYSAKNAVHTKLFSELSACDVTSEGASP